jgi:gluconate 2-dehydrogenase gamma chain
MRRRQFLVLTGATIGGTLVYSLDRRVSLLSAQEKPHTVRIPLRFLTEKEALILTAAVSRIFPSDRSGPGAAEAGVAIFIDRQLAGPWGRDAHRYAHGPFVEDAAPEFGYQGKATPRELYRAGLKQLAGLDRLSPEEQDKKLDSIEKTPFFALLQKNTLEGMFSDPIHGGNVDMIGWQLVGFPGPRMSYAEDIDRHFGEAFRPKPMGLSEILPGRKLHPLEEEDERHNEKSS